MKIVRSLACGVILSSLALPCWAGPPYSVDGPYFLEAQRQYIGFNYSSSSGGGKETESAPGMTYRYGIMRDLEFKIDTGLAMIHKATTKKGHNPSEAGLADTNLQLKYRLWKETKNRPGLAFGFKLKTPTADKSRGLGTGVNDESMWLSMGKSFGRFNVYGNAGCNVLGAAGSLDNAFYGMVTTYQLTEHLQVGAQFYGNGPKAVKTTDELAWGIGAIYNYAPDHALFASLGKSERGYSNLNVYVGTSITFK